MDVPGGVVLPAPHARRPVAKIIRITAAAAAGECTRKVMMAAIAADDASERKVRVFLLVGTGAVPSSNHLLYASKFFTCDHGSVLSVVLFAGPWVSEYPGVVGIRKELEKGLGAERAALRSRKFPGLHHASHRGLRVCAGRKHSPGFL